MIRPLKYLLRPLTWLVSAIVRVWITHTRPIIDKILQRWIPTSQDAALDWVSHTEMARIDQEPLRARFIARWIGLLIAVALAWATLTQLDEITRGEGKVIPSRQVQMIQSVDGGVITDILVTEGSVVHPGDTLMKIDSTRFISSLRENRAQYFALLAKVTRLKAISEDTPFHPPEEVRKEIPEIVAQELQLYSSTKAEMLAQKNIAEQQVSQRTQEMAEAVARRDQAKQGLALAERELDVTQPLLSTGAVSEVDIIRLQREVARYRGDRDQAQAQISRAQSAIYEATRKIQEVQLSYQNRGRAELSDANAKLNALSESSTGLKDRVKYTEIKSSVHGTIKRLFINSIGGVVPQGKEVMEIVPLDDELLLETHISPKDIAFLHPGQKANVKFTAYDFSIYGGLEAVVEQISADSVVDEKGNAFYIIRVRTKKSSLGNNLPIIPGMLAEVDILTGKKSVLHYLLKPILRAKEYAFTEH